MADDILPGDAGDAAWASLMPLAGSAAVALPSDASLQQQVDDLQLRLLESQTAHVAKLGQLRAQLAVRDDALSALQAELSTTRSECGTLESRALAASLTADAEINSLRGEIRLLKAEVEDARKAQHTFSWGGAHGHARDAAATASPPAPAIAALDAQLRVAVSERDTARADLAARDKELRGIEAHVAEQQSRIRALHEQLATFITREATDGARIEDAAARAAEADAELAKRKQWVAG